MTTRVTQVTHLPYVAIGARIENEQELTSLASLSPQVPAHPRSHALPTPGPLPVRIHNWNLSQALAFVAGVRVRVVALANTLTRPTANGQRAMATDVTKARHPQPQYPIGGRGVPIATTVDTDELAGSRPSPPWPNRWGSRARGRTAHTAAQPPIHEGKTG